MAKENKADGWELNFWVHRVLISVCKDTSYYKWFWFLTFHEHDLVYCRTVALGRGKDFGWWFSRIVKNYLWKWAVSCHDKKFKHIINTTRVRLVCFYHWKQAGKIMKKRKKHISASNHCRLGFFSFLAIRLSYLLLCVAAIVLAEHGSLSCVHVVDVSSYGVDLSIVG